MSDFKIGTKVRARHDHGIEGEVCGIRERGRINIVWEGLSILGPASWFERVPEPEPTWFAQRDGDFMRVYRTGEHPCHEWVIGSTAWDERLLAALMADANKVAPVAEERMPVPKGVTKRDILEAWYGPNDLALYDGNFSGEYNRVVDAAVSRIMVLLESKAAPPPAKPDFEQTCCGWCGHENGGTQDSVTRRFVCQDYPACQCRSEFHVEPSAKPEVRCDKAERFAGTGWQCSRAAGHDGPCAAHPPAAKPEVPGVCLGCGSPCDLCKNRAERPGRTLGICDHGLCSNCPNPPEHKPEVPVEVVLAIAQRRGDAIAAALHDLRSGETARAMRVLTDALAAAEKEKMPK